MAIFSRHSRSIDQKMESKIVISSEYIKPSSPTPPQLKTYKFSMLDQMAPSMLAPVVLYFSAGTHQFPHDHETMTQQLKRSLSVILTRFYPLAGRAAMDGQSIECNDSGVPFAVVAFNGHKLMDLLRNPDQDLPQCLLPCEITWNAETCPDMSVVMIQVNYFACGGIAIGAVFWHKALDGSAIGYFLQAWAATCQGSSRQAICPNFISQSLFPHREELQSQFGSMSAVLQTGKSVMRRYLFDASAISSLKAESGIESPTRVEVVSALIWKCFMAASLENNKSVSLVTHAVNLRRRAQPPFPSDCFGNFPALAAATNSNNTNNELGRLVSKMREAVSKIDGKYVDRILGENGLSGYHENLERIWSHVPQGADMLSISSCCGFGMYNIDFGWGKPVWITRCDAGNDLETSQFLDVVWLMDSRVGDGIEAWVTLEDKYMSIFDNLEELRAVATVDPSPLCIV